MRLFGKLFTHAFCTVLGFLFLFAALPAEAQTPSDKVKLGVFHFAGWDESGSNRWPTIKPSSSRPGYPEREPLLGWYDDSQKEIIDQQLTWMADYGIDFVAFTWYRSDSNWDRTDATIHAYHEAEARKRVNYALLWANHFPYPRTLSQWEGIVDDWIEHFKKPEYLRIDGRPVIFIFANNNAPNYVYNPPEPPDLSTGQPGLAWQAKAIRESLNDQTFTAGTMLEHARNIAEAKGQGRIYFVQGTIATDYWVKMVARDSGVDALSAYNYHFGIAGTVASQTPLSRSFTELDMGYQMQWDWILNNTPDIPYFVPMTSGWDASPWGQSGDHQKSVSSPQSFEAHLHAGRERITRDISKTKGIGIFCCWNEFGEGSYIEPTKRHGFEYLERIRKVFGEK